MLHNFSNHSINNWEIVDDAVMGGRSLGNFSINKTGNGVFKGTLSTLNNGGFSSVRMTSTSQIVHAYQSFLIRLKGDCKKYQFRIKPSVDCTHSYITTFQTNGSWQEIELPFHLFFPSYRGRRLNIPNYNGQKLEQLGFLIANKINEEFYLEIDWIKLK